MPTARHDWVRIPKQLQLASLVGDPPEGDEWLHEQKFDGYRILAVKERGKVRLLSRSFRDWTAQFPRVAAAVAQLPAERAMIDGEVAAVLPDGRTSFQALQNAFGKPDGTIAYFAFDLLSEGDDDVAALPLEQRKARLERLVAGNPIVRFSDHVIGHGGDFFALACKRGLEGIVSKRRDRPYAPGRGATWLKTKCLLRQELVIGGFTEPEGTRTHLGALLVGYYSRELRNAIGGRDSRKLVYAGKVGTGFSQQTLVELGRELAPLVTARCPFTPEPLRAWTGARRHWVEPKLVAEVAFGEWTDDGRLRHPSFQGLRRDKPAAEVVRETTAPSAGRTGPARRAKARR
jgi:bifunctional non-homologous end joining protein LigD